MIELEILSASSGCGRCQHALEIIRNALKKYQGKVRVTETDVTKKPEKLLALGVMATPAILINGKLVFEGSIKESELDKKIKEALV